MTIFEKREILEKEKERLENSIERRKKLLLVSVRVACVSAARRFLSGTGSRRLSLNFR